MKTKFYLEPSRVGGTKASAPHLGLMKWMAAMPIYGKNIYILCLFKDELLEHVFPHSLQVNSGLNNDMTPENQ